MALDVPSFLRAFPEFQDAPPPLVAAKLAYGMQLTPARIWGNLTEQGAFLYTARFLALSPYGRKIGLVRKDGKTNYDEDLTRCKRMVTSGYRVL